MVLLIAAIILAVLFAAMYFYMNAPELCKDCSMPKKKYIYFQKSIDLNDLNSSISRAINEILGDSQEAHALLHKKTEKGYENSIAILYFDSPKLIAKYKKVRVCIGLLANPEENTQKIEDTLKSLGYETTNLMFTRGVIRTIENPIKDYGKYKPSGLEEYPRIEGFILKNREFKELLVESESYKNEEIEFAEIINPAQVQFYRPLFHANKYQICTLPALNSNGKQKAE